MKVKDAIGREWQMSTIQFDFNLPERFDLSFVGDDNKEHRPYMVHRALFGSIERFFGILLEHHIGAFPLWLAPEQIRVLPITDNQLAYAQNLVESLRQSNFRVTVDTRQEKIGAKIRDAQLAKVPYMLIVGAKEVESNVVAVRSRTAGDLGTMPLPQLVEKLKEEETLKRAAAPLAAAAAQQA